MSGLGLSFKQNHHRCISWCLKGILNRASKASWNLYPTEYHYRPVRPCPQYTKLSGSFSPFQFTSLLSISLILFSIFSCSVRFSEFSFKNKHVIWQCLQCAYIFLNYFQTSCWPLSGNIDHYLVNSTSYELGLFCRLKFKNKRNKHHIDDSQASSFCN